MSITAGLSQVPERNYKKSFHQRHDSGELDVFEAARYFSGANEVSGANFTHQKMMRGGRISLDIPMMTSTRSPVLPAQILRDQVIMAEKATKEKKYKQPNSPGGRLASFLNSLFSSQNSSKKKKSKSSSIKDGDHESPVGRRKRRSSISHFPTTVNLSNNIIHSSSNSGFRTPPPYANTPTKNSLKDFRNSLDHRPVSVTTLSKNNCHVKFSDIIKKSSKDSNGWLDEKFKFSTSTATKGFSSSEKYKTFGNGISDRIPSEEREFRNFINEVDDGADSDSSSDLFELPNYDLGCCYSSGLPVYETTHMDTIKRGAPIASGAI